MLAEFIVISGNTIRVQLPVSIFDPEVVDKSQQTLLWARFCGHMPWTSLRGLELVELNISNASESSVEADAIL